MGNFNNILSSGTILHGNSYSYVIQKVLGQGAFGITYLAKVRMQGELGSIDGNIKVAIKEFFMHEVNGREGTMVTSGSQNGVFSDYRKKFAREAMNLSKLQHTNIIKVLESFKENNTIYYAMEYIDGGSLDDYISQKGKLPEQEAIALTKQIGSALSFMHQNKMLHLDLKPGNIMRKKDGTLVLIDFGLSKTYDSSGEPESSTTVGRGTPGYAPLEQANYQDGHGFPVTMDVYALGATMYKMLTGKRVPEASEILNEGLPIQSLKSVRITHSTIEAIKKAMYPIKKKRIQTISELLALLGAEDKSEETTVDTDGIAVDIDGDNDAEVKEAQNPGIHGVNSDNNMLPILDDTRKFHYFDYVKGKSFGMKYILALPLIVIALMFLFISSWPFTRPEVSLGACLFILPVIWLITLCMQRVSIGLDGIKAFTLRYHAILTKTFIEWDEIKSVTYYTNGLFVSYLDIELIDGSKKMINIGALRESASMIYNLIAAYHNRYYNKNFDWKSVMRNETEKESKLRSILFSVGVFIVSFLASFVLLVNIEERTYSAPLYIESADLGEASDSELQKHVEKFTKCQFLYLHDINKEKKAVEVEADGKHGVFDYATNSWLIHLGSTDEYKLMENYITKEHDDGDFNSHVVAYYDYNGNESTLIKLFAYFYFWGAILASLLISLMYYRYRRDNK